MRWIRLRSSSKCERTEPQSRRSGAACASLGELRPADRESPGSETGPRERVRAALARAHASRRLRDDAVHLEALRVLAVHVHAVNASEVPDVLGVGVAPMLLGGVAGERSDLALDVRLLERDVRAVGEVEVVPGNLVAEDRRPLEGAQTLLGDRLVVLVDVVVRWLEDDLRLPLVPERDEELEDVLAALREGADVEVVNGQRLLGDAELGRRLADLAGKRVGLEPGWERARRDRERDVAHLAARVDEPGHRPAAAELAVVGVRREHERALEAGEHRAIQ